jgi:hypothetical protein
MKRIDSEKKISMLRKYLAVVAVMLMDVAVIKAEDYPTWMKQAAAANLPTYSKEVSYVVLHDEQQVKVDGSGHLERTVTHAIKIMVKEGREFAKVQGFYTPDTDTINEFRAWLIKPDGKVIKYGKSEIIDMAVIANDIYNDARSKFISASEEAEQGSIFGYEIETKERSVFGQFEHIFQERAPALFSRLTVTLPERWTVESLTFNNPEIKPVIAGNTYTWELKNLPFIAHEPLSPTIANVVPRLVVGYFPPADKSAASQAFKTWGEVSQWLALLHDPQAVADQTIIDKARELTSGSQTELEKITSIARFSQSIRYVSIQMGLGRGGGYRPHLSTDILKKSYGDCKDKVNLMRVLLQAVGITAFPTAVYSGDRYYVRKEWPSPQQFNHCILAIKINGPIDMPAVVQQKNFGHLLFFDPTDPYTKLGAIPLHEQGSYALVIAKEISELVHLPEARSDDNRVERKLDIQLSPDGSIATQIHENMIGQAAATMRREISEITGNSYKKMIEEWISRTVTGATISTLETKSDTADGHTMLDVSFAASRYAKLMQQRLLIFNPVVVSRRDSVVLTESSRKLPIELESESFIETVKIKIPSGFSVDETPGNTILETPFGTYRTETVSENNSIQFRRSLTLHNSVIPPEQYEKVKGFFLAIRSSEEAPIVFIRK